MFVIQKLICIVVLLRISSETPIILDVDAGYCTFTINTPNQTKPDTIKMFSNTWIFEKGNLGIYYRFCGNFSKDEPCSKESLACLYTNTQSRVINLGSKFIFINNQFHSVNGEFCTSKRNYSLVIDLTCPNNQEDGLQLSHISFDKCEYYLRMRRPNCTSNYATEINGQYVSLISLKQTFNVHAKNRNFSISLGNIPPVCSGLDVNACEYTDTKETPISLTSNFKLFYVGRTNELVFKSHTTRLTPQNIFKYDKRFEMTLKCNWEKDTVDPDDLVYVEKQIQGSRYNFELETSYGCIKKPVVCMVSDHYYTYDLSGLYNQHKEVWTAKNPDGGIYFLHICGSAKLARNESCRSTYAQVCENIDSTEINRGSVMKPLTIINDVITSVIESGSRCKEDPNNYYSTSIDLFCDKNEQGPKFVKTTGCRTFFSWNTPRACPQIDVTTCQHVKRKVHKCMFNYKNAYYDLRGLSIKQTSIHHEGKDILINICGPIEDPDAPCMKDVSIAMKHLDEENIKYRVVSLGKLFDSALSKGDLVLSYSLGALCEDRDYTSEIRFKCSNIEKTPIVLKVENCHYTILWETYYGCPKQNKCSITDKISNHSMDFTKFPQKSFQFTLGTNIYMFDLCQNNYTICNGKHLPVNNDCRYAAFSKISLEKKHNESILYWTLSTTHSLSNSTFDRGIISFKCQNNPQEYKIRSVNVKDSMVHVEYGTNLVCSSDEECSKFANDQEPDYCHHQPSTSITSLIGYIVGAFVLLVIGTGLIIFISTKRRNTCTRQNWDNACYRAVYYKNACR